MKGNDMTLKEKLEFLLRHIDVEFEFREWSVDYDSRTMLWGDWEVVCADSLLSDNVNISECEFRERK